MYIYLPSLHFPVHLHVYIFVYKINLKKSKSVESFKSNVPMTCAASFEENYLERACICVFYIHQNELNGNDLEYASTKFIPSSYKLVCVFLKMQYSHSFHLILCWKICHICLCIRRFLIYVYTD